MSDDLLAALALVLVIEGLLPAIVPDKYQKLMLSMSQLPPKTLRSTGITTMIIGAVLLYLIRH